VDARGMSVYLVRGDPVVIDSLLADIWPGRARAHCVCSWSTRPEPGGAARLCQRVGQAAGAKSSHVASDDAASEERPELLRRLLLVVQSNDDPANSAPWPVQCTWPDRAAATVTVFAVVPSGPENAWLPY